MNLVRHKKINLWLSAKYFELYKEIFFKFPITPLQEVIKQQKESILIQDNQEYKRCRVQLYAKGIELRDTVKGSKIKTKKQQVCKANQFLVAEIDAKMGGYGIVPEALNGAVVSSHYFLYDINTDKLLPSFLGIYVKTDTFHKQIKAIGSTNYAAIRPYQVLEYEIPLPPLTIQNQLVSDYQARLQQASQAEQQASQLEQGIETYLLDALGIEFETEKNMQTNSPYKFLQMVDFKDISRWDVSYLQNYFVLKSRYNTEKLAYFIDSFMLDEQGKSLRFESVKQPNGNFYYLGMEHLEKETGRVLEMPFIKGNAIKSQTIRVPQNYFIYGKLRPYLNKYWFNDTNNKKIICSSEFLVFSINNKINWQYFLIILSSIIVQKQINNNTSGVRMPRMNEDLFKDLQIPLPPLPTQNEIVAHINTQKAEIKRLKAEAERLRQEAKEAFEREIFN